MKSWTSSLFRSRSTATTTAAAAAAPPRALYSVSALRLFSTSSSHNNTTTVNNKNHNHHHHHSSQHHMKNSPANRQEALWTPKRELHRATHPLHLVRRLNAHAQQQHDFLQYASAHQLPLDLARYQQEGGEDTMLNVPASHGQPLRCRCCAHSSAAHHDSRRHYHPGHSPSGTQKHLAANDYAQQAVYPQHHMIPNLKTGKKDAPEPGTAAYEEKIASLVGGRMIQSVQREQPPRGSGIQPLLDFNKQWAAEVEQLNPDYFIDLAKQQKPQYLWIGCSDSRVPANEIVGLYPGDIFVHRNIANVVCSSDLNALAVLQYAVQCLKVEHVIVTGHHNCGGVTAALNDTRIGLADHWILHVKAVKKRHWRRMAAEIPKRFHLDALCELNVLAQVESVVETHLIQEIWREQNAEDSAALRENRASKNKLEDEVEIHGWVYGLADGLVHPLLSLNRRSNVEKCLADATSALFYRYGQMC